MNLPPSIEAIVLAAIENAEDVVSPFSFAQRIAHEACRLQREADKESARYFGLNAVRG